MVGQQRVSTGLHALDDETKRREVGRIGHVVFCINPCGAHKVIGNFRQRIALHFLATTPGTGYAIVAVSGCGCIVAGVGHDNLHAFGQFFATYAIFHSVDSLTVYVLGQCVGCGACHVPSPETLFCVLGVANLSGSVKVNLLCSNIHADECGTK